MNAMSVSTGWLKTKLRTVANTKRAACAAQCHRLPIGDGSDVTLYLAAVVCADRIHALGAVTSIVLQDCSAN